MYQPGSKEQRVTIRTQAAWRWDMAWDRKGARLHYYLARWWGLPDRHSLTPRALPPQLSPNFMYLQTPSNLGSPLTSTPDCMALLLLLQTIPQIRNALSNPFTSLPIPVILTESILLLEDSWFLYCCWIFVCWLVGFWATQQFSRAIPGSALNSHS